ncbi:MAG: dipeptidase, partial [Chloroflexota bacterium]
RCCASRWGSAGRRVSDLSAGRPPEDMLPLVDGHLDLAEDVTLFGCDLTLSVAELRRQPHAAPWQATVSLPELRRAGAAVVMATVTPGFLAADVGADFEPRAALYSTPEQAEAQALRQVALYEDWERQGRVRLIKSAADLRDHLALWAVDRCTGLVLLMESADPIRRVGDLRRWWQRGLRAVGLTYGDTRYAGGVGSGRTAASGRGLTAAGLALLDGMAELGMVWDLSHLAEAGAWQGLDRGLPYVCASHANARALIPSPRHLSDALIRALAERDGVIGLVLYNAFLEPGWRQDHSLPVTLSEHLARQAHYIAGLVGWAHIGIGSDLDGGFGRDECPLEIETVADLRKIGEVVPAEARPAVLGGNWLRFLARALP